MTVISTSASPSAASTSNNKVAKIPFPVLFFVARSSQLRIYGIFVRLSVVRNVDLPRILPSSAPSSLSFVLSYEILRFNAAIPGLF